MNFLYLLQRQPQWKQIRHWATALEWVEVGGPVVVDGFKAIGTASSITVLLRPGEPRVLRASDFDAVTIAKLASVARGVRSADLLVIADGWGDQDVRGEIDTAEYLRKAESRRATLVTL